LGIVSLQEKRKEYQDGNVDEYGSWNMNVIMDFVNVAQIEFKSATD
jgi:hypothetical protein